MGSLLLTDKNLHDLAYLNPINLRHFRSMVHLGSRRGLVLSQDTKQGLKTLLPNPDAGAKGAGAWVAVKELKLSYHNGYIYSK